ncbi:MAG: hypothetical protein E7261_02255 [Lachnospiraceae bacterium]|nr:hypothetical protein [Lachnospiraceae bacterium]
MSAIWGVIDKRQAVLTETVERMQQSMQEFRIDRYESIVRGNAYFACGHQHITPESETDVSPVYDEAEKTWFTADCYLYNRTEVIDEILNTDKTVTKEMLEKNGDAMLSYRAYKCFGERFIEKLKGAFSIVIYRELEKDILMYTDHLARRYLAYYNDESVMCFASVYHPILELLGNNVSINREWLCTAYSDCTADTVKLPRVTIYENVFQVEPGHYVKINIATNRIENICYYNPTKKIKSLPKMSDNEYKKLFIDTFSKTVESMLRSAGETGIMLSGGLDSSAVAAFAAITLAKGNKKLYSYTSVPGSDFQYENTKFFIENETDMVLEHSKMHPNIISRFIEADTDNCFTNLKEYVRLHRAPVKPVLNMPSIVGMTKAAEADGCKVLLSGQNGNATISYGNILTFIYQKCLSGHFLSVYREAKAFCRFRGASKKKVLSVFLNAVKEKHFTKFSFGTDCFLKEKDIEKYNIKKVTKRIEKKQGTGFIDSKEQHINFCFMPLVFQHMGFFDTYSGLKFGMISLDPTLTTDMIELCMGMPIECFVKDGKERRAVRDYMKGYVPDRILDNHLGRGMQAADFAYRVNRDWDKIREDVLGIINDAALKEYFDENKINELISEAKEKEHNMDKGTVAKLAVVSSLVQFLKMHGENRTN